MINFEQLTGSIRVPLVGIEFSSKNAQQGSSNKPYRALIIGPRDPAASGTAAVLDPHLITSEGQANQLFGPGSILANMVRRWLTFNRFTELWAVATGESGFVTSAGRLLTVGGPSTAAGELIAYVAGRRMAIAVGSGATAGTVATALANRINSIPTLPVSAGAITDNGATATFTITAKGGGSLGSEIPVVFNYAEGESFPAGVTVSPGTTALFKLAAGVGEPDLDEVWSAIGDKQFDVIVQPWTTPPELTDTEAELAERWGPLKQNDGLAVSATSIDANAAIIFGETRNSPHVSVISSYGSPHPSFEWAAAVGALVALEGAEDPARPFQRLQLTGLLAPSIGNQPPIETRNLMLFAGISTHTVDGFGVPSIERLITTYQKDDVGLDDTAYLDANTVLTLSILRWSMRNRILGKYPRAKLANDGERPGASAGQVVTPGLMRAELVALFAEWQDRGWVEDIEQFKRDLIVERDVNDPTRLNVYAPANIVNQLRVAGVQLAFIL